MTGAVGPFLVHRLGTQAWYTDCGVAIRINGLGEGVLVHVISLRLRQAFPNIAIESPPRLACGDSSLN